jgi:hypothetical protein
MKPGFAPLLWRQMFPLVPFCFVPCLEAQESRLVVEPRETQQLGVDTIAVR